ncbi:MAG: aldo/keto reductase [Acholeplasmataceae bacterium]
MSVLNENFVLSNGVKIPKIGFGTWQIPNGEVAYDSVMFALKHGYRHIDTAAAYRNEESVGKAIKDSGIPREEIFVTTKLESHIKSYQEALDAFELTIKNLGLDYVDLYLIHAPWPWSNIGQDCDLGNIEAWKALEVIYKSGRAKSIGVSNFNVHDLENVMNHTEIVPHVNQIAYHIGRNQSETQAFCDEKGILVEAYSPLATGRILNDPIINEMANKYNVSAAQICIRYCLEKNTLPLPKSTHDSRIIENAHMDFEISKDDMVILDSFNK